MNFQGKKVCAIGWQGKGVDSFITEATWEDSGENLTNDELDALTDSDEGQDFLCQENCEKFGYYTK